MLKNNTQKSHEPGNMPEKPFIEKWKDGISQIPPLALTIIAIRGSWITILGILCGIVVAALAYKNLWWLMVVLIGALMNSLVVVVGQYKQKWAYQKIEEQMRELEKEVQDV